MTDLCDDPGYLGGVCMEIATTAHRIEEIGALSSRTEVVEVTNDRRLRYRSEKQYERVTDFDVGDYAAKLGGERRSRVGAARDRVPRGLRLPPLPGQPTSCGVRGTCLFRGGGREAHASVRLVLETVRSVEELHAKAVARQERLESESTRPPEG